jgi:hypothetical protein
MFSNQHREQWEQDGYVPLGQVAGDAELAALRARMDSIMLGQAPRDGIRSRMMAACRSRN